MRKKVLVIIVLYLGLLAAAGVWLAVNRSSKLSPLNWIPLAGGNGKVDDQALEQLAKEVGQAMLERAKNQVPGASSPIGPASPASPGKTGSSEPGSKGSESPAAVSPGLNQSNMDLTFANLTARLSLEDKMALFNIARKRFTTKEITGIVGMISGGLDSSSTRILRQLLLSRLTEEDARAITMIYLKYTP